MAIGLPATFVRGIVYLGAAALGCPAKAKLRSELSAISRQLSVEPIAVSEPLLAPRCGNNAVC